MTAKRAGKTVKVSVSVEVNDVAVLMRRAPRVVWRQPHGGKEAPNLCGMTGLTFDTGALIALGRRRACVRAVLECALAVNQPITVSADLIVEWWRSRTDVRDAILASVDVEPRQRRRFPGVRVLRA